MNGRGNYTRLCERCGKPFIRYARHQKICEGCKIPVGKKKGESIPRHNRALKRFKADLSILF